MSELKPLKIDQAKHLNPQRQILSWAKWVGPVLLVIIVIAVWMMSSSSAVFNYVFGQDTALKKENGRVNVLLLGIAGGNHDGPNLTDTIIVSSYDINLHQVALISVPRDLWIDKNQAKVNTLYALGLEKGDGLGFAKKEIGAILGLDIPYAVRMDFSGFEKAIDVVGGVDVNVAKSFDDYAYPLEGHEDDLCGYQEKEVDINDEQSKSLGIPVGKQKALIDPSGKIATVSASLNEGLNYSDMDVLKYFSCRYEYLSFQEGLTRMDGIIALKFIRSRHSLGPEGSDFARSRRQQLVLQAFKEKALSLNTLVDLKKVVDLVKTFGASIDSDIPQSQYLDFIKLAKQLQGTKNVVIDESGDSPLLITPRAQDYGGAWVLIPPNNDFSKIRDFVKNALLETVASDSAKVQQ